MVRVERCLDELENGIKEVKDLIGQKENSISIGTATARMLSDLMKAYLIQNTDVRVKLLQVTQHTELLHQLEHGEIDICISSLPLQKNGICCKKLIKESIYLIVPPNHKLAKRKKVSLKELEKETFIFYTTECGLGETVKYFCKQVHFNPNISCECTTPEVTCGLVEAGLGLAFLPEYISSMEYTKGISWIPVNEPDMHRTIWVSWNEERYLTKAVCDFREFLFTYFSK